MKLFVSGNWGHRFFHMIVRDATESDFTGIASLHAESWRSAYSGVLSNDYLQNHVEHDRLTVWQERFSGTDRKPMFVVVAEMNSKLAGFSCVFPDEDADWGSFLDNLHVAPELTGQGIGRKLLSESARRIQTYGSRAGLYLWVIEQNRKARRFYERAERWSLVPRKSQCRMAKKSSPCGITGPILRAYYFRLLPESPGAAPPRHFQLLSSSLRFHHRPAELHLREAEPVAQAVGGLRQFFHFVAARASSRSNCSPPCVKEVSATPSSRTFRVRSQCRSNNCLTRFEHDRVQVRGLAESVRAGEGFEPGVTNR